VNAASIAAAYRWACALDVEVSKPGNVSRAWPGHGMTAEDFLRSAVASAGPITARSHKVGARIEAAIEASWGEVGCNTNLGIVLLCAPLARAAEALPEPAPGPRTAEGCRDRAATLRARLGSVLAALDVDDARAAFRAIARARPAGLGRAAQGDVHQPPQMDLLAAMQLAADRDLIARQYATGFAECFERALPLWCSAASLEVPDAAPAAMLCTYLDWLARHPDSHIVRKHGEAAAQSVTREAARLRALVVAAQAEALAAWDTELKRRGLNPGTSADLSVATAFIAALCSAPSMPAGIPG
jgi:triphosphoribosyl-dephospho-CoA synthase